MGAAYPHPDGGSPSTMVAGVMKRFAFKPPPADKELLREFNSFVKSWLSQNLTPLSSDTDVSFETWLKNTPYAECRKVELRRVYTEAGGIMRPQDFRCKSFMKDETYPEFKHGRAINSRSDLFKCHFGPFIKVIENVLYHECPFFIKHVPVPDRPAYIRNRLESLGCTFDASDYTAFESLFTTEMMEACEEELYTHMLKDVENFSHFLELWGAVKGRNKCDFKHFVTEIDGTRMSGEMNTSLGNGFSNLMFMLFVCFKSGCSDVTGVVEGDDGLFRYRGVIDETLFTKLGLVIKLERHSNLCTASFCGLIFDERELINITNPIEVLISMGYLPARYARSKVSVKMAMMRCRGLSLRHQYPGCPIIDAYSRYLLRVTRKYKIDGILKRSKAFNLWEREQLMSALSDEKNCPDRVVGSNTRYIVQDMYNISVHDQIEIERYLDSLLVVTPLNFPKLTKYYPQPAVDYWDRYALPDMSDTPGNLWAEYSGFQAEFPIPR